MLIITPDTKHIPIMYVILSVFKAVRQPNTDQYIDSYFVHASQKLQTEVDQCLKWEEGSDLQGKMAFKHSFSPTPLRWIRFNWITNCKVLFANDWVGEVLAQFTYRSFRNCWCGRASSRISLATSTVFWLHNTLFLHRALENKATTQNYNRQEPTKGQTWKFL